ncbi:MAG: SDR family oxidoreductase [Bacteroidales bacterium]|nr:SDR family oxidoreductase [Bacteroidales bacterium]
MEAQKVLVAGATGYLGQYLVNELKKRDYWVRVLIRKESQRSKFDLVDDFFVGQITDPETIKGVADGIDWVFSTVGITRQKDGLTYMDVDYQGNINLLNEAEKSGVKAFEYISAINGQKLRYLKIFEAKEKFVDELKSSGLRYCVLRPNGYFSDMGDFLEMAKGGRVYLFGDGNYKLNPIDGEDLAKVCVDKMISGEEEADIGGPDVLSQNEIAKLALDAWNKPVKISHFPDWIRTFTIWILRTFTSSKTYGPFEFFLTAMAEDNVAPQYGEKHLKDYYSSKTNSKKK